ncbi:MAG: hypothetical protein ACK5OB_13440 [Pirellula sp.]
MTDPTEMSNLNASGLHPSDPSKLRDLIAVVAHGLPLPFAKACLADAVDSVRGRLDVQCVGIDLQGFPPDDFEPLLIAKLGELHALNQGRLVIVPFGISPMSLPSLRAAVWFSRLADDTDCYLAKHLACDELGEWIAEALVAEKRAASTSFSANSLQPGLKLVVASNATREEFEQAACTAFWASRAAQCSVHAETTTDASSPTGDAGNVKWSWSSDSRSMDNPTDVGVSWCRASSLASWIIGRYLDATRSRPLPWPSSDDPWIAARRDFQWQSLARLTECLDADLPSEYSGQLDAVSPRSMGSASLRYGPDGLVPWDKIWTSFCDLAMAGGPPHRGKLLEPVSPDAIVAAPEQYATVVREMRRGIQLASGLNTADSPYLGWVAVQCENERMAAWMMRAILVENVSVRREGNVLYVPAGPAFRVEKEIKNVITSIAKTVHYWQAHLRSRQPPKPL